MRASRPTLARKAAPAPFGRALAAVCGGGPWPFRTPTSPQAPRADASIGPYRGLYIVGGAASRLAVCLPLAVGADSISARGVCGGAGPPGRYRIGPYRGLLCRGDAASRLAAMFPVLRRAGVHARRTAAISKPGRSCRRKVRRDEGIPPHACPQGRARPVWPGACRGLRGRAMALPYPHVAASSPGRCEHRPLQGFVYRGGRGFPVSCVPAAGRRGGFHIRPGCLRRRGAPGPI